MLPTTFVFNSIPFSPESARRIEAAIRSYGAQSGSSLPQYSLGSTADGKAKVDVFISPISAQFFELEGAFRDHGLRG